MAHGAHEPLYKQIRRPATLPKAGASGDGCLYSALVLPSGLPFPNAKAPRSSSQPYGGVALQDGTLLGPILHHDLSVPVGGTTGHPESTEGSVAHPPRDLLGEDICYPIDTKNSGTGAWWIWNPVEADRGHGRPTSLQCMRSLTHACLCCRIARW